MEVRKIRSKTIYQQVADEVRSLIETGTLRPGDRLPPLAQLAAEFGVSRAAVREAITALQGMGLVDVRHGEGTFVRVISMDAITDPFQAALLLGQSDLLQLLEVRELLERGIAEHAARRRTVEDVHALSSALFAMETATEAAAGAAAELAFHLALARATGNSILINVMNALAESLKSLIERVWMQESESNGRGASIRDHRLLFDAVSTGDPQEAGERAQRHVEKLKAWLFERNAFRTGNHATPPESAEPLSAAVEPGGEA